MGRAFSEAWVCMHRAAGRWGIAEAYHAVGIGVPNFQTEATSDFHGVERGGPGVLQLGNGGNDLRQTVKGNAGVQMMKMVIANIGREPRHDRTSYHETGGFQCGFVVGPTSIVAERHARKIVLSVEQIAADSTGKKVRDDQSQQ